MDDSAYNYIGLMAQFITVGLYDQNKLPDEGAPEGNVQRIGNGHLIRYFGEEGFYKTSDAIAFELNAHLPAATIPGSHLFTPTTRLAAANAIANWAHAHALNADPQTIYSIMEQVQSQQQRAVRDHS
jgi:hypothetical protein